MRYVVRCEFNGDTDSSAYMRFIPDCGRLGGHLCADGTREQAYRFGTALLARIIAADFHELCYTCTNIEIEEVER